MKRACWAALLAACGPCGGFEAPECPASGPVLDRPPVDLAELTAMAPIGTLVPPDHTFPTPHMYFIAFDAAGGTDTMTLKSPGHLFVTQAGIRAYDSLNGVTDFRDIDLDFAVCANVEGYFIHVRSVSHPALKAAIDAAVAEKRCDISQPGKTLERAVNERACNFPVDPPVELRAGEVIGTAGDRAAGVTGNDLGTRDYRVANGRSGYARPERWCDAGGDADPSARWPRSRCWAVSPLELMPAEVVAPYLPLMRNYIGIRRTEAPVSGNDLRLDVAGTAQGYWFAAAEVQDPAHGAQGVGGPEYLDLYLGPHDIRPSLHAFSMGASFDPGLRAGVYWFAPRTEGVVNRRFDAVMPGAVHCFESLSNEQNIDAAAPHTIDQVILAELAAGGRSVRIEPQARTSCGAGPYTFTDSARTFYR